MDCNKDEAIKAKEIAEKKMASKDFVGAKKFALKAQQLYSEVDSIPQILTVCDVHCSAEQKMGIDMDWYGILKVELNADETSIKKQYRKLALLLHPDKNKLEGAEAAFKLIGEAHRVLSDRAKRSVYDMKYRGFKERAMVPQPRQNINIPVQRQPGVLNSFGNISRTQFTSVNLHREQNQADRPTFWTVCPFCNMRYQYYRDILNRALRCQSCTKPFIAYDVNVQGVPSVANWAQPAVPQPKEVSQGGGNLGSQSTARNFPFNVGHGIPASEPVQNKAGTSKVNMGSKTKAEENGNVNGTVKVESQKKPKFDAETRNTSKKKKRFVVESSESCDTESSSGDDELKIPRDIKGGVSDERNTRRSSRQKRQVIYNEDSDDDFAGTRRDNRSAASLNGETSNTTMSDGFAADDVKKQKSGPEASGEDSKVKSEIDESLNANHTMPDPEFIEVVDPDFYVFDNDRKEDCFKNDQVWAVYDNIDGMPRFYARIRKVFSPGFKVKITWLEANPDDQDEIEWVEQELPVSCGKFKHGKTEVTEDINMFSHSVTYGIGAARGSILMHPRKGEIWAIFKNWDIKWSSDAENHRTYEFDFVEILSDFDEGSGTTATCLEKEKGFVSLFSPKKGVASLQVPPNELYRFSHMLPSYRTTGKERYGVPEGSFELDPASLPSNLVDPKDV